MPKPTDIRLREVESRLCQIAYRTPMKFGGRVVTSATLVHVRAVVETRDGRRGAGLGSMPMSNIWAWPAGKTSPEQALTAMLEHAQRATQVANGWREFGHPLDLTHGLGATWRRISLELVGELGLPEAMPRLAQLVATSPIEAAIHDAFGKALDRNSYDLLSAEYANQDLSAWLNDEFQGEYLDRYTLRTPKPRMPLYHLVGALDALTDADLAERVEDGLPQTLPEWINANGLTHLKIKLNGDDLAWDVRRVVDVESVASPVQTARGCPAWRYSLDFNERCGSVQYVLEFLAKLGEKSPKALGRVHYIEQPTHRDLRSNPENRMHDAAAIKPVVIDESLLDLESLQLCREMGYSGVALKACKGHSEALLMGAAAQKYQMFLCVQDLTCPGASFMHSASLSARIPTVAAIEGNARQYCPAGNFEYSRRYPEMFEVTDGTLGTSVLTGSGLGYDDLVFAGEDPVQ